MANFAILRVAKLKTVGALVTSGKHNFRERETKNADGDRLHLNVHEGANNTSDLTKAMTALLPSKRRKDAVIGLEYLIGASPEHFGADWRETENFGIDYFTDAVKWLERLHGKENVVCKTVHLDESTPHMAVYVVPMRDGKLNAKAYTGGRKALSEMQTSFAKEVGLKHGLVRGIERSTAVHQDSAKIQPMTAERLKLRKQVKELEAEIDRLTKANAAGDAQLADALTKLEKAQTAFKKQQAINMQNLGDLNQLENENTELKTALEAAQKAQEPPPAQKAQEAAQKELDEFLERHAGLPMATPSQARAGVGIVVEQCGLTAVLRFGINQLALHQFKDEKELQLSIERGRGIGVGGRS